MDHDSLRSRPAGSGGSPPAGSGYHLVLSVRDDAGQGETAGEASHGAPEGTNSLDLELDGPFSAFFGQGLYVNIYVIVPLMLVSFWKHKGAGILSFSSISVACLAVSSFLHWASTIFSCDCIQKVTVLCWLAYLSVLLRMVAATFLLLLLDPVRHLVVILPLALLALVLLGSFFDLQKRHTNQNIRPAGRYWREHEAEQKLGFDVSSQVTTFAFAGLLGTLIGYVNGSSSNETRLSSRGYMAPDCFLSYSILLGLLVQLLSTVTPYIRNMNTRKRMAKVYLRIVAYASLMFLVLASVMAAEEILQEWVFIACFVVVMIPVLFFWLENTKGPDWFKDENNGLLRRCFRRISTSIIEQDDDKFDKASQQIILGLITPLFAALMASNSKYSIKRSAAVPLSGWFKCSVLLEFYGVLSYAVRMVVFSEMPEMKSSAFPKMVWILSSIATVTITIIVVVVVGCLHPDEITNLF